MPPSPVDRPLSVIGAPSSAGAYGPGQERAPEFFRAHGLVAHLRSRHIDVTDRGDIAGAQWRADPSNPTAGNVDVVARVALDLAEAVAAALHDDHAVLVLGGDCTVELGTVSGALRDQPRVGLAYVDLDADLNTPDTGDGILDWMGVAHLLDVKSAHPTLASIGPRQPLLTPDAVRLFAVDNITGPEQAVIERLDLQVEPLAAVVDDLAAVSARTQVWARDFDRILVHVDADVLDFESFPIAENTGRRGGLHLNDLQRLLTMLCNLPNWRALTLSEVNPAHAPNVQQSFSQLIDMLGEVLTGTDDDSLA